MPTAISRKQGDALFRCKCRSIDIQIIYLTDPSPRRTEKGKMVVIRREDDHRTSHAARGTSSWGSSRPQGATTYYPLGGRNSPLKRLYSDNPTFPFLHLICPERRHFNTCSRRITRHKYGRIYASTMWKIVAGVTTTHDSTQMLRRSKRDGKDFTVSTLASLDHRTYWKITLNYSYNESIDRYNMHLVYYYFYFFPLSFKMSAYSM